MSYSAERASAAAPADRSETADEVVAVPAAAAQKAVGSAPWLAEPVVTCAAPSFQERPEEASPEFSAILWDQAQDDARLLCGLYPTRCSCSAGVSASASPAAAPGT